MKMFSILLFTVVVTVAIEAYRIDRHRMENNELEERGNVNRSSGCTDRLNKPNAPEIARQAFGDWLTFMHPEPDDISKIDLYIGKPNIDQHEIVGYSDYASLHGPFETTPELFMICDMTGKGLKLKDIRTEMSVKIRAQRSHFFNYVYLSAYDKETSKWDRIWYDILRPIGKDQKQEWIVLKNDQEIEPIFYFKSAYRPNEFLAADSMIYHPLKLGTGRWIVQLVE